MGSLAYDLFIDAENLIKYDDCDKTTCKVN